MGDIIKLEDNIICHGCLSSDRQLYSLGEHLQMFNWLIGGGKNFGYKANDIRFCFECKGKIMKVRKFQLQLMQAQNSLVQMLYGLGTSTSLSNLTTKIIPNEEIQNMDSTNKEEAITFEDIETEIKVKTEKLKTDEKDETDANIRKIYQTIVFEETDKIEVKNDVHDEFYNDIDKNEIDNIDEDDIDRNDLPEPLKIEDVKLKRKKRKVETFRKWKAYHRDIFKQNAELITEVKNWGSINEYYTLHEFDEKELEERVLVNERIFTDPTKYKHYCSECKLGYRSMRDYQRHNDLNHRKTKSYKCSICKKVLPSQEELSDHWRQHSVIAKCKLCNKYLKIHGMRQHLNLSHVGKYACKPCDLIFQSLKRFGIHYRKVHMNYTCDYCKQTFKCKIKIANHIKNLHTSVHCKECNRTLPNKTSYKNHCTVVHPEKVNKDVPPELRFCVECDKQYPSVAAYNKHLQDSVKHTSKRPKKASCPECGKIFHKITNMKNHYNLYHLKKTDNYCQQCDKYFARASGLRKHYQGVHLKIKLPRNIMCDLCGRYFTTRRIMLNHRATHTGERAHSCLYCNATFIQKYAMQSHMKTQHKHYS